ncbi:MAG: endolytic transglycosylase MltG [Lachnospiraceae bacterium]|nr:endolytic transglycosylase MltG [Lachnospiraceae bacterium]
MKNGQIVGAVLGTILKVVVAAVLIVGIYKVSMTAYDYGFRIFGEPPVSEGEGRLITVTVPEGKSVMEIGELLVSVGLIRDAKLFYIQEMVSAYKDELKPGIYELSTSMTAEEMMAIMAEEPEDEENE